MESTWSFADLGSARIDFSPDGRFVIITPWNAKGAPLAWDLHERRAVSLTGPLKNLYEAWFTFVAPNRLLVAHKHYGIRRDTWVSTLLAFPSGEVLARPTMPEGRLARAADPGFALVRPNEGTPGSATRVPQPAVQAVELRTGKIITNETAALDVLGNRYVAERADGELELYEKGHGQSTGDPVRLGRFARTDAVVRIRGHVLHVEEKQLVVQTSDSREVTMLISDSTRFVDGGEGIAPGDIRIGELLEIESIETDDEEFQAVSVRRRTSPPAQEAVLEPPTTKEHGASAATSTEPHPTFLQEARHFAKRLSESPPDYRCVEQVKRYRSDNHAAALWKLQDVVRAEIVRKGGKEDQLSAIINGKPTNPEKIGNRSWSIGDFGAVLVDVLAPSSATRMQYRGEARLGEIAAVMYSFHINAEESHWLVREGGQTIRPARTGTIWFDRGTKRVLRIEFQGVDIPRDFPTETLELAIDYDFVGLGEEKYLVPVHADQLGCRRGVAFCTRNSIEFLEYRRLNGESESRK